MICFVVLEARKRVRPAPVCPKKAVCQEEQGHEEGEKEEVQGREMKKKRWMTRQKSRRKTRKTRRE